MKYTNILSEMTWSYSRIKSFESCPYGFFLKYIKKLKSGRQFFSDYGSFIHSIIEQYLLGLMKKDELVPYYLARFKRAVGKPPSPAIFKTYFTQGHAYLETIDFPHQEVMGVERKMEFEIDGKPFVGVLDYETKDEDILSIGDNKSRTLKERSGRKKPTKTDIELDEYFRQLYLYSIPFKERYGRYPNFLEFNCFRIKKIICEPFDEKKLKEAKAWASEMVNRILQNEDWEPRVDYWKCRYLCDQNKNCEYFQMNRR